MSKVKLLVCCQLAVWFSGMGSIPRTALLMHLWGFVASGGHLVAVKSEMSHMDWLTSQSQAAIAQFGERQTEDLKVPGSIPGLGKFFTAGQKNRQYSEQCSEASFCTPKCCTHEAKCRFRGSFVVSISACPGSIPGRGVFA